jgi:predicted nucleic acid-binding protein
VKSIGVIGILEIAKKFGKIDKIKNYLDKLMAEGYWISKKLYAEAMMRVGEE